MKVLGVIPARMAATRFPNKPMAEIQGIPMIAHCYVRCKRAPLLDEVYVATCDQVIVDYMEKIGGRAVMTSDKHERASERSAEALLNIEKELGRQFDIVVMIQGDEPLVDPDMIREAVEPLLSGERKVTNLMSVLTSQEEQDNPNNVKVVTDTSGNALYMSREAIPSRKKFNGVVRSLRQLGLIAFTRESLLEFYSLEATPLEVIESVDMNRFLEHGVPVYMIETRYEADAVDHPEDIARINVKMASDPIFQQYKAEFV
jgi:3-deoxy-manno-octulosonate cytidylyltransferase (CMP-KDO synthetase)